MENFQLYRTNVLLGGQMKWDLILNNLNGNLTVSDFHLSPINVKYPKYSDENLINYPHHENIRKYYKEHEGSFYDLNLDPRLTHDHAVISDNVEEIYEDSFESGASYCSYQLYKKSIEIFCPIWLEQLTEDLKIEISVFTETDKIIGSKTVNLNTGEFGKYFLNYIKHLGLDKGIEDVLDINFGTKKAVLTGLDLDSGNIIKKDVSHLIPNLLYRERPMMEFDSMIINLFKDNKAIARQLFNFNLCFDLNDIISGHLAKMIYGSKFKFKATVKIGDKELEMRDFYSNYSFIGKEDISIKNIKEIKAQTQNNSKYNVLDYLYDYQYVNYMNKNKYVQSVIHWSLNDNPEYLFNLYNGFGPYDGENFYSHKYGNSPDLLNPIYNPYSNNIGWCSCIKVDNFNDWLEFIQLQNLDVYNTIKDYSTDFKKDWVNNIKYEYDEDIEWDEFKISTFIIADGIYNNVRNQINSGMFKYKYELGTNVHLVGIRESDGFYAVVVKESNIDDVTYVSFNRLLKEYKDPPKMLTYLSKKLDSAKSVPLISINKSLYIVNANSPSKSSTEIEYYKDDNALSENCYVLRYDGKIKPTFLNEENSKINNIKYFKTTIKESDYIKTDSNKYINSGFPPIYKSIGYYHIKEDKVEYNKYNQSLFIVIPEIEVDLFSENKYGVYKTIEEIIKKYIKNIYNTNDSDTDFIYNMYDIESSYDYTSPNDLDNYIYHIKMTLK